MIFKDEAERQAWSSAWDARANRAIYPLDCRTFADAKIEAMRERQAPPAAIKPEAPGVMPGVKPLDPLSGLAAAMAPAPTIAGGGRLHYAIQRGAELAWTRLWERRVHLSHCDADRAHFIDCIYDAMVDSVVERPAMIDAGEVGDLSAVDQCSPGPIHYPPSERGALDRVENQRLLNKIKAVVGAVREYVDGGAGDDQRLRAALKAVDEEGK